MPDHDGDVPTRETGADPDRPERASEVEQVWILVRIIGATLLILVGFALAVGLLLRLT